MKTLRIGGEAEFASPGCDALVDRDLIVQRSEYFNNGSLLCQRREIQGQPLSRGNVEVLLHGSYGVGSNKTSGGLVDRIAQEVGIYTRCGPRDNEVSTVERTNPFRDDCRNTRHASPDDNQVASLELRLS